jgi:hypothetical protein
MLKGNGYYHWISVVTYIQALNDEGIIEDKTAENMKDHLYSIKYFVDDEMEQEILKEVKEEIYRVTEENKR